MCCYIVKEMSLLHGQTWVRTCKHTTCTLESRLRLLYLDIIAQTGPVILSYSVSPSRAATSMYTGHQQKCSSMVSTDPVSRAIGESISGMRDVSLHIQCSAMPHCGVS